VNIGSAGKVEQCADDAKSREHIEKPEIENKSDKHPKQRDQLAKSTAKDHRRLSKPDVLRFDCLIVKTLAERERRDQADERYKSQKAYLDRVVTK